MFDLPCFVSIAVHLILLAHFAIAALSTSIEHFAGDSRRDADE